MLDIRWTEITTSDGQVARIEYDPEADILEIFFDSVQATTAVHLHDSIVLRINQPERRPSGLIIVGYRILSHPTAVGPRSIPLSNLDNLPEDLHALVSELVTTPPVSDLLKVTSYFPTKDQLVTLAYVDCPAALALAA
ncbi:MAG: DUF2283 domain-containing protein [Anaerolineae bacterium]